MAKLIVKYLSVGDRDVCGAWWQKATATMFHTSAGKLLNHIHLIHMVHVAESVLQLIIYFPNTYILPKDIVLPGKFMPTQSFPFIALVHHVHWKSLIVTAFK